MSEMLDAMDAAVRRLAGLVVIIVFIVILPPAIIVIGITAVSLFLILETTGVILTACAMWTSLVVDRTDLWWRHRSRVKHKQEHADG